MGAHEVYSETTFSCADEVSNIFVPPTWGQGQMILLKVDSQAVTGERTKLQIDLQMLEETSVRGQNIETA